jgi:hypothetical protein
MRCSVLQGLASIFVLFSVPARADVLCTFSINSVSVDSYGSLMLDLEQNTTSFSWWFCNTAVGVTANNGYNDLTVPPQACQPIYSQFLSARMSGRPVSLQFHGPTDCSATSLPAGGFPSPYPIRFAL